MGIFLSFINLLIKNLKTMKYYSTVKTFIFQINFISKKEIYYIILKILIKYKINYNFL